MHRHCEINMHKRKETFPTRSSNTRQEISKHWPNCFEKSQLRNHEKDRRNILSTLKTFVNWKRKRNLEEKRSENKFYIFPMTFLAYEVTGCLWFFFTDSKLVWKYQNSFPHLYFLQTHLWMFTWINPPVSLTIL